MNIRIEPALRERLLLSFTVNVLCFDQSSRNTTRLKTLSSAFLPENIAQQLVVYTGDGMDFLRNNPSESFDKVCGVLNFLLSAY